MAKRVLLNSGLNIALGVIYYYLISSINLDFLMSKAVSLTIAIIFSLIVTVLIGTDLIEKVMLFILGFCTSILSFIIMLVVNAVISIHYFG